MRKTLFFTLLSLCAIPQAVLPQPVTPLWSDYADTVIDSNAVTLVSRWGKSINGINYQQEALLSYKGWQYLAFYRGTGAPDTLNGHVCLARRKVKTTDWEIMEFDDYLFRHNDSHNIISMGICSNDGTIHLEYDNHDNALHYRVSAVGVANDPDSISKTQWETNPDWSIVGRNRDYLIEGEHITDDFSYPRFWTTPDGNLQLWWRMGGSGYGDSWIGDYDGTRHVWTETHQVITRHGKYSEPSGKSGGSDRCAYMNVPIGYGPDGRLHISFTWREAATSANHDILYAYSEDGGDTWKNDCGVKIADRSTGLLMDLNSPGLAVKTIDSYYAVGNMHAQTVDADGNVHVIMGHATPETYTNSAGEDYSYSYPWGPIGTRRYFHYWKHAQTGEWKQNMLMFSEDDPDTWVGRRGRVFVRPNGDAYFVYIVRDVENYYPDLQLTDSGTFWDYNKMVIQAATAASGWGDWHVVHTEPGPFCGEPLLDLPRLDDGILSIMVQDTPESNYEWTPLRLLEYSIDTVHTNQYTARQLLRVITRVNEHWQEGHPDPGRAFWDHAAYHTGNMEAFSVTGNKDFLDYSIQWAERNQWMGAKSPNPAEWRYDYGENDRHVLFGDWQICFQTYIDIYTIKKEEPMIARAREVMEYQMSTDASDYWWWADGLYMVMPVMTKLYKVTGDERYLEKLAEYFAYAKSIMYDEETGLFFRDRRYVCPKHQSLNGKKDFWARGVGWVFAGLAKVLADMPADCQYRDEFLMIYRRMAESLADCQQDGGYWTRSLLDPEHAPGYETSGTAFFTYGYLRGIRNGLLDRKTYLPVALKGWDYLATAALQGDGRVGYVQPTGERAIPGQIVDADSTSNFGVGAFLLAASEMVRLVDRNANRGENL